MTKALLLDTHVLLWWLASPKRLGRDAAAAIRGSDVTVSVVSFWELWLKAEGGRLRLPDRALVALVDEQGFRTLPLRVEHAQEAADIGGLHLDPYDRLLVGTAKAERLTLLTRDAQILDLAGPALGNLLMQA